MDGDLHILEQSLTAKEWALQEKIVRLEKKLEGYQSQIDVIDNQREQLEESVINMEELFEVKDEAMEREIAEMHLEEKLKSMTQQAEEYKNLFIAERNNNRHRIETLEAMMSTVKAEMATRKEFDGFSNEMLSTNKESFHTQLTIVSDKLTEAQNELIRQPRETNLSKFLVSPVQALQDNSITNDTSIKKTSPKENLVAGAFKTEKDDLDFALATTHAPVVQSEERETLEPTTAAAAKVTVLTSSQLFTIGRGDSSENEEDIIYLSPRETSSSRRQQETAASNKLSTAFPRNTIFSTLPQGTNVSSRFTFSLQPPHVSTPHKLKSPLPPTMPLSPVSPSHTEPYFKPVIPLPDEIQVVKGEEGLEVMFSERAKLYRFDSDAGQWKERGVGDVKLLRHPKTGQGRVLMRREHIKKLCANHNVNVGMALKPNVGSDRSWVWYTPADYAEGEARAEKLAIKLKSAEIAGKFKEVFEDLKETLSSDIRPEMEAAKDQQGAGCTLHEQFLSRFAAGSDAWTCEVCLYVQNKAENSKCVVCNSDKPAVGSAEPLSETAPDTPTSTSASLVESIEPNAFQDFNKDLTPAQSVFQSPGVKGSSSSQLFTIGRGESNKDKFDDDTYPSPSKTSSPSKPGVTPQKLPTPFSQESVSTNLNLPFGTNTPAKFTFSLQFSPKSPPRKPKSPISPGSPESPDHTEDDGPHFKPLIPLPEKVECRTGEEGQEVLFCDRCKLFRYNRDASQWKERGIGDIKILLNPSSGKYRILMRREHVFKLCANHLIFAEMELKPFPNSDRSWLWTTLADFSEEVAAAETLGARFRTNEIAIQFKETFDKALQSLTSKGGNVGSSVGLEGRQTNQGTKNSLKESSSLDICPLEKQSAVRLQKAAWTCEVCYVENKAEKSKCVACNFVKPAAEAAKRLSSTAVITPTTTSASVVESVEPNVFQASNKDLKPAASVLQSHGVTGWSSSKLFTIGWGESSEEKLDSEIHLSPSKTSSSNKHGVTPQEPSTHFFHESDLNNLNLPFGTNTPATFTFSVQVSPKSPPRKAVEGQHDGKLYFEPVIPLPDEIQVVTGEEGLDVLFSERAKLYRFDADSGQWKERGVGDVKLLRHPQTGQGRVLMRREHIKKLCANHNINTGMELKPNVGSDRSWVWYTPADYAEGEARAEKLAIKLKSAEIAGKFKEVFHDLKKSFPSPVSSIQSSQIQAKEENDGAAKPSTHCNSGRFFTPKSLPKGSKMQYEEDCLLVYEGRTSVADREKASRLWLPPNFFNYLKRKVCSGCLGCRGKAQLSQKHDKISDVVPATFTEETLVSETKPAEHQKDAVSAVYNKCISTLTTASEAWTCEVCYVENNVHDSKCIACSSMKPDDGCEETLSKTSHRNVEYLATTRNASVVGTGERNAFHDLEKDSTPVASSVVQLPGVKGLTHSRLLTSSKHGFTPQKLFVTQNEDHDDSATEHIEPVISRPDLIDVKASEKDEKVTEEDHDGPHFEPIIPLPDEIDVKTGKEDEEVTFSNRAKLYRFVTEDKQWKERGVGDIKLLRNRQSGKVRVLMRRDQVLKICANHQITTDMKLQPNAGSEKSWVWSTLADFSEQECKAEQLAVKFKSEEIAKQFKEKFEECQEMLKNQAPAKPIQEGKRHEEVKDDLFAKFKAAERSWECDNCMVQNDSHKVECVACGSLKPGAEPPSQGQNKDVKPLFAFGSTAPFTASGFSFGSAGKSQGDDKPVFTFGSQNQTTSSSSGVSFGSDAPSTGLGFTFGSTEKSEDDKKPVFTFGSQNQTASSSSEVSFGFGSFKQGEQQTEDSKGRVSASVEETPRKEANDDKDDHGQSVQDTDVPTDEVPADDSSKEVTTPTEGSHSEQDHSTTKDVPEEKSTPSKSNFLFGSASVSSLSFQSVAVSPLVSSPFNQKTQQKSPGFTGACSQLFATQTAEDDGGTTEGDHDPHFEPVIPLPDKIDVKTGEEDEEVMFSHRARLYRFVAEDKQWKERGVGDIKLLRNRQSGKMRVLMRRDQVLKICANHQITTDMKLQPNAGSEKSWVWSTLADFSEQECKAEQLAVKFKSEEIAKQFKEKFEECQKMLKNQTPAKPIQEGKRQEEVKEDLLAKLKASEGWWECDICMVQNDSDKVECVACGSLKPGAEPPQSERKDRKPPFSFGTAAPSTRSGFSFGTTTPSGFTFASAIPSTGTGSLFGSSALSTNSGNSLGSVGTPMNRIKRSARRDRR